jgi:glycosyltransferase involved in cell wall biosynthesis
MIPVINENGRLKAELERAAASGIGDLCDIVVLDGGSTDGSVAEDILRPLGVNALLMKLGPGRQGAQLRMGFHWALLRGYEGFITIDGNNKDSIEDAPRFIEKLREGYDLIQGSRYLKGGRAINTPPIRHLAVRLIHAPITSLAAGRRFTDSTNAFRGYSRRYISHPQTDIFRDLFDGYELLAYLSARATRLGLRACEIPVTRAYPPRDSGRPPTKISPVRGSASLLAILLKNLFGAYNPRPGKAEQKDG